MRFLQHTALLLAFALLLPLSALARDKDHGTMQLGQPAWVGTTQLQPGTYKVDWTGSGSAVTVNVKKGNNTLATVPATLKTNDQSATENAVVLAPADSHNGKKVVEIDFGNKDALFLSNTSQQMGG